MNHLFSLKLGICAVIIPLERSCLTVIAGEMAANFGRQLVFAPEHLLLAVFINCSRDAPHRCRMFVPQCCTAESPARCQPIDMNG